MGYRSEVAYTIRFKDENSYRLFIAEAKVKDLGKCFNDDEGHLDEAECDDKKWHINFSTSDVKWYDSYPEVDAHNKLIALAGEWVDGDTHVAIKDGEIDLNLIEHRLGFIFIRIGENSDDIEETCGGDYDWDWLRVSRQIITDWS
jgi:hypothetical protein